MYSPCCCLIEPLCPGYHIMFSPPPPHKMIYLPLLSQPFTRKTIMKLIIPSVIVLSAIIQSSLTCFPTLPSPFTTSPSPSPSQPSATSLSSSSGSSSNNNNNQEVAYNLDCQCGAPSKNKNRIVGGQPAEKNEYPWQVAIKAKPNQKPFCGGSILSSRTILTAAHCNIYKAHETR